MTQSASLFNCFADSFFLLIYSYGKVTTLIESLDFYCVCCIFGKFLWGLSLLWTDALFSELTIQLADFPRLIRRDVATWLDVF